MKRIALTVATLAVLALTALPLQAADMKDMSHMHAESSKGAQSQVHKGHGTVNRIDEKSGKINLSHDAINDLNWPAMTMDFPVADKHALAKIKSGQKVDFKLTEKTKGQYVITDIAPAK